MKDGDYVVWSTVPGETCAVEPCAIRVQEGRCVIPMANVSEIVGYLPAGSYVEVESLESKEVIPFSEPNRKLGNDKVKEADLRKIDLSGVPKEYREKYLKMFRKFTDVFDDNCANIGKCGVMKQRIVLKDKTKIVSQPPYRTPPHLQKVYDDFIDTYLAADVIRPSTSPFSSPLMLVKKPKADPTKPVVEQYRVVNDFRRLNQNTVKDSYPLQSIYQLIDEVAASKVASIIDLRSAFHIQELEESSKKYTSFAVPGRGLFEYNRSPQGLINSSSSFQRLLDHLMRPIPNVRVYIDDIVIFSNTHEHHLETLVKVLSVLSEHGFRASVNKMQIACGAVNYLGYEIKPGTSVKPGLLKTKAIKEWPVPDDISKVRQFLGLCSFFRRTIPRFAEKASALTKLTRKDSGYTKGDLPGGAVASF